MAQLSNKIKEYCKANGVSNVDFFEDVKLQDDSNGQGAYIAEWNLDIAQPTDEQLASYETAANTAESNAQVDATRRQAYGSWNDQLDEIYHDIDAWKARIQVTTNNSSYNTRAETTNFTRAAENYITTSPTSMIIDVTDTANVKVRPVYHVRSSGTDVEGGSIVRSYFKFIRLGDT